MRDWALTYIRARIYDVYMSFYEKELEEQCGSSTSFVLEFPVVQLLDFS